MYKVFQEVWRQNGIGSGSWTENEILETPDREEAKRVRDGGNFRYAVKIEEDGEINFHSFMTE